MSNMKRSFCLTLSFILLSATRLAAQTEVAVLPGEPLRMEIVGPANAPIGARCLGRVMSAAQDTLIVASEGKCKQGSYLARLQVIRGDRGDRLDHIAIGALAGGLVGIITGRVTGNVKNSQGEISQGKMWAGLAAGAAAGGAVGYFMPAGPRWVRAGSPRPLRVSGVQLRPGLEVSLARPEPR